MWSLLRRRSKCRHPAAAVYRTRAAVALGLTADTLPSFCRYLASVAIFINQFGSGVVYVLLSAELIRDLVKGAGFDMVECYWIVVIAAILTPCTFLGSPKDFW